MKRERYRACDVVLSRERPEERTIVATSWPVTGSGRRSIVRARAKVTQLLDLLLLAPDLQARVLELEAIDGAEPMTERSLRAVAHEGSWADQRAAWAKTLADEQYP